MQPKSGLPYIKAAFVGFDVYSSHRCGYVYFAKSSAFLAVLLAGYLAQKYLPPPPPRIVGIDLGTTFSCIAVYHSGSGIVEVIPDSKGRKSIPSIVAFE
ncbi:unnamed protein product [Soboliphyme baturini]|uniref:Heat shock 70 kDa protein 14 n=1 Tax=Soboliphyme baturini TaxID=241478 RepID=A0A183IMU2_9BILA|nr:unnamed protein product [Soboliphyme baturini]